MQPDLQVLPLGAMVDTGCMDVIVSLTAYRQLGLTDLLPTTTFATLADGRASRLPGRAELSLWIPTTCGADVVFTSTVPVMDRGPAARWDILLGKPWLQAVGGIYFGEVDVLFVRTPDRSGFTQVVHAHRETHLADASPSDLLDILVAASVPAQVEVFSMVPLSTSAPPTELPASPFTPALTDTARWQERFRPSHVGGPPPYVPNRADKVLSHVTMGGEHLTKSQNQALEDLVREFEDVFALSLADVKQNRAVLFDIELKPGTTSQFTRREPRLSPADAEWVSGHIDELLACGQIEPIDAADVDWLSAVLVVPKASGAPAAPTPDLEALAHAALRDAKLPHDQLAAARAPSAPRAAHAPRPLKRRLVYDYVALNKATKSGPLFPTGTIEQQLGLLSECELYSSFDGMSGFSGLLTTERAKRLLSFSVAGKGKFTHNCMPFGPTRGPDYYQYFAGVGLQGFDLLGLARWMDNFAKGTKSRDPSDSASAISDATFADHLHFLRLFFLRCRWIGLMLAAAKCTLASRQVKFCGHVVSAEGIASDPAKVAAIVEWPQPDSALDLLRFVNTCSFLRARTPALASLTSPLQALINSATAGTARIKGSRKRALRSAAVWEWGPKEERSFAACKAAIALAVATVLPDPSLPFLVDVDAGPDALAGALLQERDVADSKAKARSYIAFASRRCTVPERRYPQFLRELAALRFALDRFSPFICGSAIIVTTDCAALAQLLSSSSLSRTHTLWFESLLAYNIVEVRHRPGRLNVVCDAMSRRPHLDDAAALATVPCWQDQLDIELGCRTFAYLRPTDAEPLAVPASAVEIDHDVSAAIAAFADDPLEAVVWFLFSGHVPSDPTEASATRRRAARFFEDQGQVYHISADGRTLRCLPTQEGLALARRLHEDHGHFGRDILLLQLRREGVYWPRMYRSVVEIIQACDTCQRVSPAPHAVQMLPIVHLQPLDAVAMDFLQLPTHADGWKYLLVFADYFSRFVWSFPCKAATAEATCAAIAMLCAIAATPRRLISDNGTHFTAAAVAALCEERQILHTFVPFYAPWVNGLVERSNGIIVSTLRRLCLAAGLPTTEWLALLDKGMSCINDRPLAHVNEFSPQQLLFGIIAPAADPWPFLAVDDDIPEPDLVDVSVHFTLLDAQRDEATAALLARQQERVRRQAKLHSRSTQLPSFSAGDLVLVLDPNPGNKLAPRWQGPRRVSVVRDRSVKLETIQGLPLAGSFHFNRLRRFVPSVP